MLLILSRGLCLLELWIAFDESKSMWLIKDIILPLKKRINDENPRKMMKIQENFIFHYKIKIRSDSINQRCMNFLWTSTKQIW